jgi:hypothetical protein
METLLLYSHIQLLSVLLSDDQNDNQTRFSIAGCNAKSDGYIHNSESQKICPLYPWEDNHWCNALSGFRAYIGTRLYKANRTLCCASKSFDFMSPVHITQPMLFYVGSINYQSFLQRWAVGFI